MVLALVSEVGSVPPAQDAALLAEGDRLAGAVDTLRAALVPHQRDGDMGCVVTVLTAVSYEDLGR